MKKLYVVFEGHNPGIYFSWPECFAQVNRWRNNVHGKYDSLEQAESAYTTYCKQVGHLYEQPHNNNSCESGECLNKTDDVQPSASGACKSNFFVGRFAKTEYDAKEDVAVQLIHRFLCATGRRDADKDLSNKPRVGEDVVCDSFKRDESTKEITLGDVMDVVEKYPMTKPTTPKALKLSLTPSPVEGSRHNVVSMSQKKVVTTPKENRVNRRSPTGRTKSVVVIGRTSAFRNSIGLIVAKHFRCVVKTSPEMKLDQSEIRVCDYVFQDDFDSSDIIFKVDSTEFTRAKFGCMCPRMLVSSEIIPMIALKVMWTQHKNLCKTLWCLPPFFTEDIVKEIAPEEIYKFYKDDWMVWFEQMRLIYVPIEDRRGHWYLMVISLDDQKIYHLDSHLNEEMEAERRCIIINIGAMLNKLVEMVYQSSFSLHVITDFEYWDIFEARGIPNYGTSDNSALWVFKWKNMHNNFTSNILGMMKDNVTRMVVTMHLLMGNHNELNNELIGKSKEYWKFQTTPT
ncbi:hypothetical protein RYX36_029752 [Vicia faba]